MNSEENLKNGPKIRIVIKTILIRFPVNILKFLIKRPFASIKFLVLTFYRNKNKTATIALSVVIIRHTYVYGFTDGLRFHSMAYASQSNSNVERLVRKTMKEGLHDTTNLLNLMEQNIKQDVVALNNRMDPLESNIRQDIGKLNNRMDPLESNIRQDIGKLNNRMDPLESNIRQDVVALNGRMSPLEKNVRQDIKKLKVQMSPFEKNIRQDINTLNSRIDPLESNIRRDIKELKVQMSPANIQSNMSSKDLENALNEMYLKNKDQLLSEALHILAVSKDQELSKLKQENNDLLTEKGKTTQKLEYTKKLLTKKQKSYKDLESQFKSQEELLLERQSHIDTLEKEIGSFKTYLESLKEELSQSKSDSNYITIKFVLSPLDKMVGKILKLKK